VASVDRVGNIGLLSRSACASTQEDPASPDILSGRGCSMGRATRTGRSVALLTAFLALAILRARRREH
jgi:hypothetical protein